MVCCILGDENANVINEQKNDLKILLKYMIKDLGYIHFLFSGFSDFGEVCYDILTELKKTYPNIRRVFVRCDPYDDMYEIKYYCGNRVFESNMYIEPKDNPSKNTFERRAFEAIYVSKIILLYIKNESALAYSAYKYAKWIAKKCINISKKDLSKKSLPCMYDSYK